MRSDLFTPSLLVFRGRCIWWRELQEHADIYIQRRRQAVDHVHAGVERPILDTADVGAIHIGLSSQSFLRQPFLAAEEAQIPSEAVPTIHGH